MALNLASPGILVREVDLTIGRIDGATGKVGGIVGPFEKGPVDVPVTITGENEYVDQFGKPYEVDKHYETWMVGSSYLAYGGVLSVIRADDSGLKNAVGGGTSTSVKIKSTDHYKELGYDENTFSGTVVAAKNPGTWANGLRVAIIDGAADQILSGLSGAVFTSAAVGMGVTQTVPAGTTISTATGTSTIDGHFKGIITAKGTSTIEVKFLSHVSADGTETAKEQNSVYKFSNTGSVAIHTAGVSTAFGTTSYTGTADWFDSQTFVTTTATKGGTVTETTVNWNTIADKPGTSEYAAARGGRFDEVHVLVIDSKGTVTGNAGTILEKHLSLSKAKDAEFSVGSPSYWRKYLYNNSANIFGLSGDQIGVTTTGFSSGFTLESDGGWDQDAEGTIFNRR